MPTRPVTIGTTPTTILAYNEKRTAASFFNNSAEDIFISQDQTGIQANGYVIPIGGAHDLLRALGDEPHLGWFGEAAAGGANLRVLEAFGKLPFLEEPPARFSEPEGGD